MLKENTIAIQKHVGGVEPSPVYHNHQNSVTLRSFISLQFAMQAEEVCVYTSVKFDLCSAFIRLSVIARTGAR